MLEKHKWDWDQLRQLEINIPLPDKTLIQYHPLGSPLQFPWVLDSGSVYSLSWNKRDPGEAESRVPILPRKSTLHLGLDELVGTENMSIYSFAF